MGNLTVSCKTVTYTSSKAGVSTPTARLISVKLNNSTNHISATSTTQHRPHRSRVRRQTAPLILPIVIFYTLHRAEGAQQPSHEKRIDDVLAAARALEGAHAARICHNHPSS